METELALAMRIRSGRGCEQSDGTPAGTYGLPTARESTPHRVASSRIAAILAAHAANDFKYGNTCPREQQLAQLPFAVVIEEHLQLN
jgi:hypothetical protein